MDKPRYRYNHKEKKFAQEVKIETNSRHSFNAGATIMIGDDSTVYRVVQRRKDTIYIVPN